MKKIVALTAGIALIASAVSCEKEQESLTNGYPGTVKKVVFNLPDLGETDTRSTFVNDASGVRFLWDQNDTVGIIPSAGDQVYFPMKSGAGSSSASFDGGSWGLKDANVYAAYYPFSRKYYSAAHEAIRLDWTGQEQDGNNDGSHLGGYDFLASGSAAPNGEYLTINFIRIGSVACFRVVVPEPGTYTEAVISSDADLVLSADMDITGATPVVKPVQTSHQISLKLKNLTTSSQNETVTLYMMMYPVDLTGHSVSINLKGDEKATYSQLPQKNMAAGKPYMFSATNPVKAISFADSLVNKICLANWDSDGNGLIDLDEAAAVTDIGTVFAGKAIKSFDELKYFTSLTSLPAQAFKQCGSLVSIELPEGVTSLGNDIFYECKKLESIVIPEGVTRLPDMALWSCSSLKSVSLPSGLKEIGAYAMDRCTSLESLTLPDGLEEIEYYALRGLAKLESITIPETASVGVNVLDGCSSLKSFTIPSSWTEIPHCAFSGCSSLESLVIPDGIKHIGHSAFSGCSSLKSITLPESVEYIESGCFMDCTSLEIVSLPNTVKVKDEGYGNYVLFSGCTNLKSVNIPTAWKDLGDAYFRDCKSLVTITVPEGVVRLGGDCFLGCSALENVSLPESLLKIGEGCFSGCTALKSIVLPSRIKALDQGTFNGCTSLESVSLPDGLVAIGSKTDTNGPFTNCTGLASLEIPSSVTFIGTYSFFQAGLQSIVLPDSITYIGDCAFERCYSLEEITLPSNLTILNNGLFFADPLKTITIPAKVASIMTIHLGNVESIKLLGTTPPALYSQSVIPDNGCPIYVPASAVETYKTDPVWSAFASRIRAMSDAGGDNPGLGGWE